MTDSHGECCSTVGIEANDRFCQAAYSKSLFGQQPALNPEVLWVLYRHPQRELGSQVRNSSNLRKEKHSFQ